jgi:hypothetical protein
VPASGGTPQQLTTLTPEDEGNDHCWPQVLPGGRAVLFTVGTGPADDARIVVQDLRTGARKDLVRGSASGRDESTGHLVCAMDAELLAMPFDPRTLQATGPAVRVAEGVAEETDGAPEYSFAANGDLVYIPGHSGGRRSRLALVDLQGVIEPIDVPPAAFAAPRVSPDGRHVAVMIAGAKNNVWVYDLARGSSTRVTFGRYHSPAWAPDGLLTVARGGPGRTQLVRRPADGSGNDETLTEAGHSDVPGSWSPDGKTLLLARQGRDGADDIWALTASAGKPVPLLASRYHETNPRYSADGRLLAYTSNETGRLEIYVRTVSGEKGSRAGVHRWRGGRRLVSGWPATVLPRSRRGSTERHLGRRRVRETCARSGQTAPALPESRLPPIFRHLARRPALRHGAAGHDPSADRAPSGPELAGSTPAALTVFIARAAHDTAPDRHRRARSRTHAARGRPGVDRP